MANIEYYAVVKSQGKTLFRIVNISTCEEFYSSFFPTLGEADDRIHELHEDGMLADGWSVEVHSLNNKTWEDRLVKVWGVFSPLVEVLK